MNGFSRLRRLLKHPSPAFFGVVLSVALALVALSVFCAAFEFGGSFAYVIYAVSAVSLGYAVYAIIRFISIGKKRLRAAAGKWRLAEKWADDYGFRTFASACLSFAVNIGFVLFNAVFAVLTRNLWYGALAGYYLCLSLIRGGVLRGGRRAEKRARGDKEALINGQLTLYGRCGAALFVLELFMIPAVTLMVLSQKPTKYDEVMAIALAAYTFYKLPAAIIHLFKAKRTDDFLTRAIRNLALADTAVSLLSLQTALIATFSEGDTLLPLNAVTGFAVCLLTVGIGVFMLARARRERKKAPRRT